MATADLVVTAIVLGTVHVLTGPDHLAALATLTGTNVSSNDKNPCASSCCNDGFLFGIKWGIGHALGLTLVGVILIATSDDDITSNGIDPTCAAVLEGLVGVFMLLLGFFGLAKAMRHRQRSNIYQDSTTPKGEDYPEIPDCLSLDSSVQCSIIGKMESLLLEGGGTLTDEADVNNILESLAKEGSSEENDEGPKHSDRRDSEVSHEETEEIDKGFRNALKSRHKSGLSKSFRKILASDTQTMKASSLVQKHSDENSITALDESQRDAEFDYEKERKWHIHATPGVLATIAGVLHGVAGPGGLLGVVSAVQLTDFKFLIVFCLTSTFVMGAFAASYGALCECLAGSKGKSNSNSIFVIEVGSACLSIAAGMVWLLLLAVGDLEL